MVDMRYNSNVSDILHTDFLVLRVQNYNFFPKYLVFIQKSSTFAAAFRKIRSI